MRRPTTHTADPIPGRSRRPVGLLVAGAVGMALLSGCSSGLGLGPSESAQLHPERQGAARTEAMGVSLVAEFDRWEGTPDPTDEFTAVLVEVENRSDRPVRLRYGNIGLEAGGRSLSPRDPREFDGHETVSHSAYGGPRALHRLRYSGFRVASHQLLLSRFHGASAGLGGFFPGIGHGFGFGHGLHGFHGFGHGAGLGLHGFGGHGFSRYGGYPAFSNFSRVELPTRDMLATAVPEGTLEPGGRVEGYLFFPHLEDSVSRARLSVVLEDGSGARMTEMELRFRKREKTGDRR